MKEVTELYTSLGFEVKVCRLRPDDLGPQCLSCALGICGAYVLIYTRRAAPVEGESPPTC